MGVTYKAFDVDLHCPVTLKVITEKFLDDELARLRFLREARAASAQPRIWISTVRDARSEAYPCGPKPLKSFTNGESVSQEAARRQFSPACVVMY
jgi:hypothetical protein